MKLTRSHDAMDLSAVLRPPGWDAHLDEKWVHKYFVSIKKGRKLEPINVLTPGALLLSGAHRLAAYDRAGVVVAPANVWEAESIRDQELFCLEVDLDRRTVEGEELDIKRARRVELYAEIEREKQGQLDDANCEKSTSTKSKPAKTRGRPSAGKTAAVERAAKDEGVTPRAIRDSVKRTKKAKDRKDQENTDPVSAELLKPPPSIASVIGRALVDLGAAAEKLEEAFRRMDAIAGEYGEKDSRWAVSGYTGRALVLARQAKEAAETASEHITSVETAKKGYSKRKAPVSGLYVGYGKDFHIQARVELGLAQPKSQVARDARKAADQVLGQAPRSPEEPLPPGVTNGNEAPMDSRTARARAAYARAELQAREEDPNHIPGSTTPEGDPPVSSAQAARERRAAEKARREDAANGAPKTGLGGARLRVEDSEGNLLAEGEETPPDPPPVEDIVQTWGEADALGLGPDGETEDEGAF